MLDAVFPPFGLYVLPSQDDNDQKKKFIKLINKQSLNVIIYLSNIWSKFQIHKSFSLTYFNFFKDTNVLRKQELVQRKDRVWAGIR